MTSSARGPGLDASAPASPRVLGRYELICRLASGGMATVHLGRLKGAAGFERLFAIKHCHPHLLDSHGFAAMFLDEARLAATIRHPHVVPTLDLGTADDLYLVMEYVEGGALSKLLRAAATSSERRLPVEIALRIVLDALEGLHAAHETRTAHGRSLEVVHRDLSPQNLLVGVDGLTRVTDFGIARAASRLHLTTGGGIKGKLGYMSPEQIKGQHLDRRSDIFSLGVVLWEALTGRHLFVGDAPAAMVRAVTSSPIPRPSMVLPSLGAALDPLCTRALARSVEDRYPTALAFAEDIERTQLPVAKHREVGALVEQLLGPELERTRSAIAAAVRERTATTTTTDEVRRDSPEPGEARQPEDGVVTPARGRLVWLLGVVLLFAGGLLVFLLLRPPASDPADQPTGRPPGRLSSRQGQLDFRGPLAGGSPPRADAGTAVYLDGSSKDATMPPDRSAEADRAAQAPSTRRVKGVRTRRKGKPAVEIRRRPEKYRPDHI